ncbi:unnamed protein product [Plutella xylostella]|uniref:Prolyl endopeptidase n=1 Tax=Plutella xylostella TaxID=51655 RepID=A0A8S4ENZ3_PLUXY|nr:unnamed protein product [Plutella xylostella]
MSGRSNLDITPAHRLYSFFGASTSAGVKTMSFNYPEVRRDETVVDDYFGTKISDPYRWLEDPDSKETKEFIDAENNITRPYLDSCPVKKDINDRLTELWNYPKYSCPFRRGDRYFFFKNTGLQNQSVLYVQDTLDGEPRVFLDPNKLSEDGTVALSGSRFTEDGATFAYGLSASGSDWITIHFKDVATGEDYPEVLEKVKFASMSWSKDNKGLFYSRYPDQTGKTDGSETEVNRDQKLCYHRLNTAQSDDVLVVEFPEEPLWRIGAEVTDCGKYLIVSPVKDCRDNLLYFADLGKSPDISGKLPLTQIVFNGKYVLIVSPVKDCRDNLLFFADLGKSPDVSGKLPLTQIVFKFEADYEETAVSMYLIVSPVKDCRDNLLYFADLGKSPDISGKLPLTQIVFKFQADYEYITNEGSVCIFRTNKDAPNYRLIKIDLDNPAQENWETLIAEDEKDVLDWASAVDKDKLVIHYVRDVKSVLQLHSLTTGKMLQTFDLAVGSVVGFSGKKEQSEIFYAFSSFLTPGVIYHVDFKKTPLKPTVFREVEVKGFDASQYEVKQVFYPSKDGTKVPMFIVHKKDLKQDGSNPALVYGYGGFNINIQPSFSVTRLVFMQHLDGIVAIPNIRGGGEYGERWHNAGRLLNKQNVFDDFQSAAEYLVKENYTRPGLITIQGGSNGGLLVAACINQRPDLYGAAIVQVG